MDAQQALADLTEISSQIQAAVVFDHKGKLVASTLPDGEGFANAASELLAAAEAVKTGDSPLVQLEVATGAGSVFIVREGKATIAALTAAAPTVGLVFYDLKSALRSMKPAPKRPAGGRKGPAGKKSAPAAPASKKKATAAKRPAPRKKKSDAS
jgi:predicted regulator of Ras-like GTPase activity (Roadblock/LC7/MglB family)